LLALDVHPVVPFRVWSCPVSPSLQRVPWASVPRLLRYYASLRLPPVLLRLLRFRSEHGYLAWNRSFVYYLAVSAPVCSSWWRPSLLVYRCLFPFRSFDKETVGPPKSLGYPFDDMHRSRIPVVSSANVISAEKCCLPNLSKSSAFSVWLTDY